MGEHDICGTARDGHFDVDAVDVLVGPPVDTFGTPLPVDGRGAPKGQVVRPPMRRRAGRGSNHVTSEMRIASPW